MERLAEAQPLVPRVLRERNVETTLRWEVTGASRDPSDWSQTVWTRGIVGVALCLVGAIWIAQGTGALHGSGMSGHALYAVLGAGAILIGLAFLMWAWRIRKSQMETSA